MENSFVIWKRELLESITEGARYRVAKRRYAYAAGACGIAARLCATVISIAASIGDRRCTAENYLAGGVPYRDLRYMARGRAVLDWLDEVFAVWARGLQPFQLREHLNLHQPRPLGGTVKNVAFWAFYFAAGLEFVQISATSSARYESKFITQN